MKTKPGEIHRAQQQVAEDVTHHEKKGPWPNEIVARLRRATVFYLMCVFYENGAFPPT